MAGIQLPGDAIMDIFSEQPLSLAMDLTPTVPGPAGKRSTAWWSLGPDLDLPSVSFPAAGKIVVPSDERPDDNVTLGHDWPIAKHPIDTTNVGGVGPV